MLRNSGFQLKRNTISVLFFTSFSAPPLARALSYTARVSKGEMPIYKPKHFVYNIVA